MSRASTMAAGVTIRAKDKAGQKDNKIPEA